MGTGSEVDAQTPAGLVAPRRRKGAGGIEAATPTGPFRGHYRDAGGDRVRLPWCVSRSDAEEQLQAALEMMANGNALSVGGKTLRAWGKDFLDRRELDGNRAIVEDRVRWKYVLLADFIDWPLESVSRRDIKRWMAVLSLRKTYGRGRPQAKLKKRAKVAPPSLVLAWQTKTHALNLLRRAFGVAIDEEIVSDDFLNPCMGLKFKKPPRTEKPTNFFTRTEIERLTKAAAPGDQSLIEFAIATGLRQGEMRALRDADVHDDAEVPYITVRYGRPPKKPTKSGLPRDVPLLPMAQRALKDWRAFRATLKMNDFKGLTFPATRGGYRGCSKMLGRRQQTKWKELLAAAGIHRRLVWHDLRHTCATALLGGYFGRKWRLEEIQQFLGHADVKTTERYAHALQQTLTDAARETCGDITSAV